MDCKPTSSVILSASESVLSEFEKSKVNREKKFDILANMYTNRLVDTFYAENLSLEEKKNTMLDTLEKISTLNKDMISVVDTLDLEIEDEKEWMENNVTKLNDPKTNTYIVMIKTVLAKFTVNEAQIILENVLSLNEHSPDVYRELTRLQQFVDCVVLFENYLRKNCLDLAYWVALVDMYMEVENWHKAYTSLKEVFSHIKTDLKLHRQCNFKYNEHGDFQRLLQFTDHLTNIFRHDCLFRMHHFDLLEQINTISEMLQKYNDPISTSSEQQLHACKKKIRVIKI